MKEYSQYCKVTEEVCPALGKFEVFEFWFLNVCLFKKLYVKFRWILDQEIFLRFRIETLKFSPALDSKASNFQLL